MQAQKNRNTMLPQAHSLAVWARRKEVLMSQKTYRRAERIIIALMLLGMVGMFQPVVLGLFRYGFLLLLFSTLLFIVVSHLSPQPDAPADAGPVGAERVRVQE
jgi:hypothetical protein